MHVTLVAGFDASTPSASGTRSHVEALASLLLKSQIPHLLVTGARRWHLQDDWCGLPVRRPNSAFHFQAALTSMLSGLPIPSDSVIHVHRPDDLLPFILHKAGRRFVCTLHGNPARYVPTRHGRLISALYGIAERSALREVHRVVAVDGQTASDYGQRYPWLRTRVRTIPNGIDTTLFRPLDRTSAKRAWGFEGTVVLYAGRLEPDKHVREILQVFLSIAEPGGLLVFAGDGSERQFLESKAVGHPVRFLGTVRRDAMPVLLNAADAAVLFSDEGLSSFALEALASGVPVIATPTGDLPEVVHPGENGFLVTSAQELRVAISEILRGGLAAHPSLSNSVKRYSWSELGPELVALYQELWDDGNA